MRKIIKRKIHISTHKRDLIDFINDEFYSHDKHNAFLEFTMKSLPTDNIIALFYFQKTKRYVETKAFVDGDKFTIEFDTSLINTDETVLGFIYFEKVAQSADVHRFSFGVKVSEIDKLHDMPIQEQTTKRVVAIEDIVTKAELDELFKRIEKNGGTYDDTEIRNSISSISERVQTLENKPDNDTIYNDTELRQAIGTKADKETLLQYLPKSELTPISEKFQSIETNIGRMATQQQLESYVSKEELGNKGYLTSEDTHNFALKSEIPEVPNLDTINEKIRTLEEKPPIDLSHLATKKEIEDSHYLTEHQSLDGLVTKFELEQKGYLMAHQSLEDYSKKNELDRVTERVQSLEARPQVDTSKLVSKEELEQKNYLTAHQSLEDVVTKQELEAKGYLTNHQDLSEYAKKTEIPPQFDSKPLVDRIDLLESKAIANGAYNDKPLLDKIHEVQESLKGFITQSSRYLTEHQSLTHLVTKDELESKGYITNHQSLEHLVTKDELANKGYLTTHQDISGLVTKQELEDKHYLTSVPEVDTSHLVTKDELDSKHYIQDVSDLATNAKVDAVEARVQTIENKPALDLSPFVTKQELEAKQYLKDHQPLDGYVKKSELPPKVDTSTLVSKQELTSMNLVNAEALGEVSKKILEQKIKITTLEEKAGYEIHGTGMPNGKVTAPIGTTYVDMAVTQGALKWIKESGNGNTGWKVLVGDTGWRILKTQSLFGSAFVKIRRVNNMVSYQFGGLDWGKFGIVRRGGKGFVSYGNNPKLCRLTPNDGIPAGFRASGSVTGPVYNDNGIIIGAWYLGGAMDLNHLRLSFLENIPTDRDIKDMRVSNIMYLTEDDWPTILP